MKFSLPDGLSLHLPFSGGYAATMLLTLCLLLGNVPEARAQFIYNDVITGIQNETDIANAELKGLQNQVSTLCAQAQLCKGAVTGAAAKQCEDVRKRVDQLRGYHNDIGSYMGGINGRISALKGLIQGGQARIVSGTLQFIGCQGGTTQGCATTAMNTLLGTGMAKKIGAVMSGAQDAQQFLYNAQCPFQGISNHINQYLSEQLNGDFGILAGVSIGGCSAVGGANSAALRQRALNELQALLSSQSLCLPLDFVNNLPQPGIPNIPNLPTVNIPNIPGLPGLPAFPGNFTDFANKCSNLNYGIGNIRFPSFQIPGINLPTLPQIPDICSLPQLPNCTVTVNSGGTRGSTTITGGGR